MTYLGLSQPLFLISDRTRALIDNALKSLISSAIHHKLRNLIEVRRQFGR